MSQRFFRSWIDDRSTEIILRNRPSTWGYVSIGEHHSGETFESGPVKCLLQLAHSALARIMRPRQEGINGNTESLGDRLELGWGRARPTCLELLKRLPTEDAV